MGLQKVLTSDLQIQVSMSKIIWIFLLSFLIFENIRFCYSYVSNKREYTLINCRENFHPTCLSIFLYMYLYLTVPYLFIWDSPSIRDLRVLTYFDHFDYLNSLLSKIMSNFWRLVRKSAKVKWKKKYLSGTYLWANIYSHSLIVALIKLLWWKRLSHGIVY